MNRAVSFLLKGILVGAAATEALDRMSIILYEIENEKTRNKEDEAREDLHAYERAVDLISKRLGMPLQRKDLMVWGWRLHKSFGYLGGVSYLSLRKYIPFLRRGKGLAFGLAFFILGDEILVPSLGLTPWASSFPWQTHMRGFLSHLAYGFAAESTAVGLDNLPKLHEAA
jgi:hypothetical protein